MANLMKASRELFRRSPDECYPSLAALTEYCRHQADNSHEIWEPPTALVTTPADSGRLSLYARDDGPLGLNDWSFTQLCRLANVSKDTVNRLSPATASGVFQETLPQGTKPLQLFVEGERIRSIHAASYTRLHNSELLNVISEFGADFEPPPKAASGGTGLYAGEQDMFCFLIDPLGWVEIEGEAFAPGFYLWNSEVGRRSVGVSTFWFQAICANHIVWDAAEVVEFTRKHTANVHESLGAIRRIIEALVKKRDERRDGFVRVIEKAMAAKLGDDAEEAQKVLSRSGISRQLAKRAVDHAIRKGALTVFSIVDALTRFSHDLRNAGDRTEADQRAARLLALAA